MRSQAKIFLEMWMVSFYAATTSNRLSITAQQALLLEVLCNNLDGTLDVTFVRLDMDLGARRGLVRRGDTGEFYIAIISDPMPKYSKRTLTHP